MAAVLLIAGIGLLLAGLLAVGFGIPVKEFSFGNTLILTGAVVACTGIMMLGFWTVVRELRNIARRLGSGFVAESSAGTGLRSADPGAALGIQAPEGDGFSLRLTQTVGDLSRGAPELRSTRAQPRAASPESVPCSRAVSPRGCRSRGSCVARRRRHRDTAARLRLARRVGPEPRADRRSTGRRWRR